MFKIYPVYYSNMVIIIEAKGACTNSGVSSGKISLIKPINTVHKPPSTPIVQCVQPLQKISRHMYMMPPDINMVIYFRIFFISLIPLFFLSNVVLTVMLFFTVSTY